MDNNNPANRLRLNKWIYPIFGTSILVLGIGLVIENLLIPLQKQAVSVSQVRSTPTISGAFSLSPFVSPSSTISPLPILTYTSPRLGISFRYAQPYDTAVKAFTKEIGNKIYLYYDRQEYTGTNEDYLNQHGYYLEIFSKDPQHSLETAIQKQFLQGYSEKDCLVRDISGQMPISHYPPHYQFAEIEYKSPEGYDYNAPATCPSPYTRTNDIAYFLADPSHPNKYVFVGPHQSPAPADDTHTWDETITFF